MDESVNDFLRRQGAQVEFAKICELARSAFPALTGLEFTLQEDPDEVGRVRVVVCVRLPDSYSDELLRAGTQCYHEQLVAQVPLDLCPLFALVTEFGSE
jgi:hypothetical protein